MSIGSEDKGGSEARRLLDGAEGDYMAGTVGWLD